MLIDIYDDIQADISEGKNAKGHKTFAFNQLQNNQGHIIAMELDVFNFTELLNAFISNQLISGNTYENRGFTAKLVTKKKVVSILIETFQKKYYLEKYEARVISKKINKILSKCTLKEFL